MDAATLIWKGTVDNNWDFTTANWAPTNLFANAYRARFDDTGANTAVNIAAPAALAAPALADAALLSPSAAQPVPEPGALTLLLLGMLGLAGRRQRK